MLEVAEIIPDGPSILKLAEIAKKHDITILAGLFEKDKDDKIFKAYVCVDKNGLIAKHGSRLPNSFNCCGTCIIASSNSQVFFIKFVKKSSCWEFAVLQ
jgi:hypothetical protein